MVLLCIVGDVSGFAKQIAAVTNAESILKDIRTGVRIGVEDPRCAVSPNGIHTGGN
jgi:hypothetical protein